MTQETHFIPYTTRSYVCNKYLEVNIRKENVYIALMKDEEKFCYSFTEFYTQSEVVHPPLFDIDPSRFSSSQKEGVEWWSNLEIFGIRVNGCFFVEYKILSSSFL